MLFGSRRRSPALFYLRIGLLAVLLLGTFVLRFSTTDLAALRIARIVIVVLMLGGARMVGGRMGGARRRRQSAGLGFDADVGASTPLADGRTEDSTR